jgi:hypothetical protein
MEEPDTRDRRTKGLSERYFMINGKAARCENCHKKIKVSEVYIINGLIYHGECINNMQGNVNTEKRGVLKTIGVGAIIAGASILGIDRFATASTTIARAGGTYNQEQFVLPGLFSDPINPLPGQVWYRMDAGVTAFFDGIQGRTIYSNRNNNVITVSSRGISNGLSTVYNDGADFGPDTRLGSSATGEYGPPYSQSTGIQEAWNYAFATATIDYPDQSNIKPGAYWMKPILLLDGIFIVNQKVLLSPAVPIANPKMIGSGMMSTYVYWDFNDNCIEIDHTNENIAFSNIEIGYMQPQAGSNVGAGTAFFAANYVSGDPSYQTNSFQSYDVAFANTFNGNAMFSLTGFQRIILYNPQVYSGGIYGALYAENTAYIGVLGGYLWGQPYAFYLNNVGSLVIYGSNTGGAGGVLSNVDYVYIDDYGVYDPLQINGNVGYIHLDSASSGYNSTLLNTQGDSAVTVAKLKIGNLNVSSNTLTLSGSSLITVNDIEVDTFNIASGAAISGQWVNSPTTPAVPSSGTPQKNTNPYPVDIYITGGVVTQIAITKSSGSTYVVMNNAAGIAMSGQGYRLQPEDSITVWYSTVPTWVWLAA